MLNECEEISTNRLPNTSTIMEYYYQRVRDQLQPIIPPRPPTSEFGILIAFRCQAEGKIPQVPARLNCFPQILRPPL